MMIPGKLYLASLTVEAWPMTAGDKKIKGTVMSSEWIQIREGSLILAIEPLDYCIDTVDRLISRMPEIKYPGFLVLTANGQVGWVYEVDYINMIPATSRNTSRRRVVPKLVG